MNKDEDLEYIRNLNYIQIDDYSNVPVIKVSDINEFLKLIKKFKTDLVYVCKKKYQSKFEEYEEDEYFEEKIIFKKGWYLVEEDNYRNDFKKILTEFLIYHDGAMYMINGWNYNTISDLIDGKSKGFKYGDTYYDAMKGGFSDIKEYKECKFLGYNTKEDYVEAKKLGFRGCIKKFNKLRYKTYGDEDEYYDEYSKLEWLDKYEFGNLKSKLKSEGDVYYYAKKLGYRDFKEFCDGISMGFKNAKHYRDAISKGFVHAKQYYMAFKSGFENAEEFEEAIKLGIKDKEEYDKYLEIKNIKEKYGFETVEEAHLFYILLNLKPGKKLSVSKIWEKLKKEQNKYGVREEYGWRGSYYEPDWYTKKFEDIEDIKKFLSKNKNISIVGTYDVEGEVFERSPQPIKFSDEIIVIDGSNVAWNEGSRKEGDKPYAKNIQLVINELRKKGFRKIVVVVDANLRHEIEDKDVFEKLKKELKKDFHEVPARTDADEFIIDYAKNKNARIITNDLFRDWKEKDEWIKNNIDKYLVKFKIADDVVKLYFHS